MRQLFDEINYFLRQKFFMLFLCITAIACYGFAITHVGIGVDDTMVDIYIQDGLEVIMGRWTCFLVNKLFHFGEYMPFITEFAGMLLLMTAAVLYCVLFKRLAGDKITVTAYTAFACAFVSCPFIADVNVYYYHDGTDLGHILCAIALLFFLEALNKKGRGSWMCRLWSMIFLWAAAGCYESFVVTYIVGVVLILFFRGMFNAEKVTFKLLVKECFLCFGTVVGCIILRSLMCRILTVLFSIQQITSADAFRSVGSEFMKLLAEGEVMGQVNMLVKRYWLVYFVNALVYLPIRIYVLALLVFVAASLVCAVREKNIWYPVMIFGTVLAPWLISLAEMGLPLYRSCQYMPLFTASALLVLYRPLAEKRLKKFGSAAFVVLSAILVWNQSYEMNRSFYTDYKKYEHAREMLTDIAREITARYGTDATVVFTGSYDQPYELMKDYIVSYYSPEFNKIRSLSGLTGDPYLIEKYYTPYGYYFGGEAQYSVIDWGLWAFDKPGFELANFLQMHGYQIYSTDDTEILQMLQDYSGTMPEWPAEGSVTEMDGYVIVHL